MNMDKIKYRQFPFLSLPRAGAVLAISFTIAFSGICDAESTSRWSPNEVQFVTEVLPLIEGKCQPCHGKDKNKIKGGLNLMSHAGFLKGGEQFPSLTTTRKNQDSPILIQIISRELEDLEMPPKISDRLTPAQIQQFKIWIDAGAPWPDPVEIKSIRQAHAKGVTVKTSDGLTNDWKQKRYDKSTLWAFQPLKKFENLPDFDAMGINPIDWFIDRKLDENGLSRAGQADTQDLIRRLSFNLTGLPPARKVVQTYSGMDKMPEDAWARLVEEYLQSSGYGEKFASHWLDLVRYADSAGMANDFIRGSAWRYRDYVIRSFNKDIPYKQFVTQQLAGDELDPTNPENRIATGFLRMGPWELTGMEVAKVARQKFLDDVTDLVGQAFLSQPLQCARCHDHKFDPIPTRDYYSIQAVFANTQMAEHSMPFLESEPSSPSADAQILKLRKEWITKEQNRLNGKIARSQRQWCIDRGLPPMTRNQARNKGLPENQIPPRHAGFSVEDFGIERITRKLDQRMNWEKDFFQPVTHTVFNGTWQHGGQYGAPAPIPSNPWKGKPEPSFILKGGDPFSPGQPVSPGTLSVINHSIGNLPHNITSENSGRRLALANWITSENNALALRSFVNRIWTWNFGRGIVSTPNHFGVTTPIPEHLDLLDFLSHYFLECGGSVKKLNQLILTSKAWRRSSAMPDSDPDGDIDIEEIRNGFACFTPRQMRYEELRDSHLKVSGELSEISGGPPVKPVMELETALQPRLVMGSVAEAWQPSIKQSDRNKRTVYTLKLRGLRDPFYEVFDLPDPDISCAVRNESLTPNQVFSLINNESVMARAAALAASVYQQKLNPTGKKEVHFQPAIQELFRTVYGRDPAPDESILAHSFLDEMVEFHKSTSIPLPQLPHVVQRTAAEENTGESFSFEEILHAHRMMEPDIHISQLPIHARALAELAFTMLNSNEFVYVY